MSWLSIIWDDSNTVHVAEHGLTPDDVDAVLAEPVSETISHSSGLPLVFGYTPDGRYILVSFVEVDEDTIYPVTAYPVPEPKR